MFFKLGFDISESSSLLLSVYVDYRYDSSTYFLSNKVAKTISQFLPIGK